MRLRLRVCKVLCRVMQLRRRAVKHEAPTEKRHLTQNLRLLLLLLLLLHE